MLRVTFFGREAGRSNIGGTSGSRLSTPSGTITMSLPQKASISSVISRSGRTASARLTISAPKREVSRVCRAATQRPDRITLLKLAATSVLAAALRPESAGNAIHLVILEWEPRRIYATNLPVRE
jgi:hypothetical protein